MLSERIKAAIIFKKGVYSEVALDATFTNTAWIIVLIVELLNQLGTHASSFKGLFRWFFGGLVLGAVGLGAFALACYLVSWLATTQFHIPTDYKAVVRALGLAAIWRVIGVIGILSFIPFLGCITGPIIALAWLASLAADLFAIKESTNLEWGGTIICAVVVVVVVAAITGIVAIILSAIRLI